MLDSIGGLYRAPGDESTAAFASIHGQRAQHFMRTAARLKQIAATYDVMIVVTNQVSDKPLDDQSRRAAAPWELNACRTNDDSIRVPSLGLAWGHCVNTRLLLTRRAVTTGSAMVNVAFSSGAPPHCEPVSWLRQMHVLWSPRLPAADVRFVVREDGVFAD